jgi:hypothetical protein
MGRPSPGPRPKVGSQATSGLLRQGEQPAHQEGLLSRTNQMHAWALGRAAFALAMDGCALGG